MTKEGAIEAAEKALRKAAKEGGVTHLPYARLAAKQAVYMLISLKVLKVEKKK
tara:strand:- start:111 stop:269 length:159 start_codon:yes stop_codon:yes gene_type:complete